MPLFFSATHLSLFMCILFTMYSNVMTSAVPSYSIFVSGGKWMKDSLMKRRIVQLPVTTDATNTLFSKTVDRLIIAEDIDGAELLDGDVEEPGNYEWTPELDAKLLSELKRLKKLRWYKVAKLMGEGATARNCHDRWRELVSPENLHSYKAIQSTVEKISDGWEDEEVSKLVSAVDNNTNKEGTVEWSKVALAMGFEASVCEDKYNKLLAEEAASTEVESNREFGLGSSASIALDDADYSGDEVE